MIQKKNKLSIRNFILIGGLPTYLLLIYPFIIALVSRQRDLSQVTEVDSSAIIQIIFSGVVFFVSVHELLISKSLRNLIFRSPLQWFLFYILFGIISVFWSVNFNLTLYRAFENLAYFLLITSAISILYKKYRSPEMLIQWVLYYAILLIVTGTLKRSLLWGLPFFSIDTLLLEQMNSTPFFFLALLLPLGWLVKTIILPVSIFSLSNTAYLGMFLGISGLGKGRRKIKLVAQLIAVLMLLLIFYFGFETFLQNTVFYGKEGVGMEYTTGRDQVYELAINEGLKQPLLGYGFVAGEVFKITMVREATIGAHNGFVSAFLGTGLIGLLIFLIFIIKIFIISKSKVLPDNYKSVFMASFILISIYTMGNPGLGSRVYGSWFSSTLIIVLISMVYLHFKKIEKIKRIKRK